MNQNELLHSLSFKNDSKILFWVFDGVGGLPHPDTGKTELDTANIPHLDAFAQSAACCGLQPVAAGVTPGSGPGHMALFGYDVTEIELPRGVLEVLGADVILKNGEPVSGFRLKPGDLAARGNFATVDREQNIITDRRAGKPPTEQSKALAEALSRNVSIDGVDVYVIPGKEHRFAVVFRGDDLTGPLDDVDPQKEGLAPVVLEAPSKEQQGAVDAINAFVAQAGEVLDHPQANTVLLRGIGNPPNTPSLEELYGIRCAAIATYPMYKGIASLVGMDILEVGSMKWEDEVATLAKHFDDYDFFYLHIKETDSYGHTGEFDKKVGVLEACDPLFQKALDLGFDAVVVTGDHCTPCVLMEHSWHPIPTALWSKTVLGGVSTGYNERECNRGTYGVRASSEILPLALAEAGRLKKFGA